MALHKIAATSTPRTLSPADLPTYFSLPDAATFNQVDEIEVRCKECGRGWAVILDNHAINRGSAIALIQHARSHIPGKPGIRRLDQ